MRSFEHAPQTGVDPSLHQGNAPSPEEAARLIDEFWQGDPTGSWQPYIDATRESLANGNSITMLSGAHGSGKTMLYARDLQYEEPYAYHMDLDPRYSTPADRISEAVVVTDEVTTISTGSYADYMQHGIAHGKQFVVVTPGPSAEARKKMVDDNTAALADRGIEVNYLGDVHDVHITPERSAELLTALGVNQEVIQMFENIPALRAPRFFGRLIDIYYYSHPNSEMTTDSLTALLTTLTDGSGDERLDGDTSSLALEMVVGYRDGYPLSPHAIFMSNNLSTADCIQMYEASGKPLPTATDFPSEELFEYSYHKD